MARKKLKWAAGVGFERSGRRSALGKVFPVVSEIGERTVIGKQAVAALIGCSNDLAALPVKLRQRSRGVDQGGGIALIERQSNRQLRRQ